MSGISIFEYLEYQQYLKRIYDENKKLDSSFSYRKMARLFGFTSPNYCKLLIDGERDLARRSFEKVFEALQLTRKEQEYFAYLVEFSRAKEAREKNYYFGKIAKFRAERSITEIHPEQFDYFSHWFNVAIRELLHQKPHMTDPYDIAKALTPSIAPSQAEYALELLQGLGLIVKSDEGFETTSTLLNTKSELGTLAIRNFHRQVLQLAEEALDSVPVEKREFSAATLSLSEKGYQKLCERLQEFREEALHIACDDPSPDRIIQLNMHLFPLTEENL